jgi:hypothetical protein
VLLLRWRSNGELHVRIGAAHRILPKYEFAAISQTEIAGSPETLAEVTTLTEFSTCFVFELRCSLDLVKLDLLIDRELQGKTMKRSAFLLGEAYLVLEWTLE